MKITVLTENTTTYDLAVEHGLSLFVELEQCCFLFDLGQSDLFAQNAERLGIDLDLADFAILSHGHYDHGGGIKRFLEINHHAPVYMSQHAFEPHLNAKGREIGLDQDLKCSDRIVLTSGKAGVADGITLYADYNAPYVIRPDPAGLKMMQDGALVPEDFRHEQYLLVEEHGKRILFSGCSHRGIQNIVHWFKPDILVGGFHLFQSPIDDTLIRCAKELDSYKTEYYTCHCTGTEQYEAMKPYMKNLNYLSTGMSIEL